MSGHSKWHNIQVRKNKQDKTKSGQFTKVTRMIGMAAKQGGADPEMNVALRLAIDKAKAINMPKDNIARAIARGAGGHDDGSVLEEVLYEGFGPGGVALVVEALTDNKNRAASEIKFAFSKCGGSMVGPGSVQWQFRHLGVVRLNTDQQAKIINQKAAFEMAVIEAGADDILEHEYGTEIFCPVPSFQSVMDAVQSFALETQDSGLEWVAKETVSADTETGEKLRLLCDALDELDDVREVYTNEA